MIGIKGDLVKSVSRFLLNCMFHYQVESAYTIGIKAGRVKSVYLLIRTVMTEIFHKVKYIVAKNVFICDAIESGGHFAFLQITGQEQKPFPAVKGFL